MPSRPSPSSAIVAGSGITVASPKVTLSIPNPSFLLPRNSTTENAVSAMKPKNVESSPGVKILVPIIISVRIYLSWKPAKSAPNEYIGLSNVRNNEADEVIRMLAMVVPSISNEPNIVGGISIVTHDHWKCLKS